MPVPVSDLNPVFNGNYPKSLPWTSQPGREEVVLTLTTTDVMEINIEVNVDKITASLLLENGNRVDVRKLLHFLMKYV